MFLLRKISHAKWDPSKGWSEVKISADAVTADLRTQDNMLSLWKCGDGEEVEIEGAALALIAASNRLDKIDIVWLSDDELQADGQTLQDTKGDTPVQDLIEQHVDVSELDYSSLGKVASRIAAAIAGGRYRRLRLKRVKALLLEAVEQKRVKLTHLKEGLRTEVCELLEAGK